MSNAVVSPSEFHSYSSYSLFSRAAGPLALLVAVWFVLITSMGAAKLFVTKDGSPPLALLIAATAPVIVFLAAYLSSHSIRELTLNVDPSLILAVQAWRIGGYSFLILYSYGLLPGLFAWPAGLGDMAIGFTAPLLVALTQKPGFLMSKTFAAWNVLGIMDLVVAVSLGALAASLDGFGGSVPTTVMSQLPLVLIPTFFVPAFVILHLAALFQARRQARAK